MIVGLTHEALVSLRAHAADAKLGVRGHSLSVPMQTAALSCIDVMQKQLGISYDAAVRIISTAFHASPNTIRSAVDRLNTTLTLHRAMRTRTPTTRSTTPTAVPRSKQRLLFIVFSVR